LKDAPCVDGWRLDVGVPGWASEKEFPRESGLGVDRAIRNFSRGGRQRGNTHGHPSWRKELAREVGADMSGKGFRGADQLEWAYLGATLPITAKVPCFIRWKVGRCPVPNHRREPKRWTAD
jgi:hypothetical protein